MTSTVLDQSSPEFRTFVERHGSDWLDDFALFTAIKRSDDLRPWWEWNDDLKKRDADALAEARRSLDGPIRQVMAEQFLFDQQWTSLHRHCADLGIGLIGDIPIFVAHDSADVWANPELFLLDEDNEPIVVAGVPPDYFSATGQRWGNPLYDWDRHVEDGFAWWISRMRRAFELFDLVRVDHFRGFAASWNIPAEEETAMVGEWVAAPGRQLFDRLADVFPDLPIIAEDLGIITEDVEDLRDRYGLPGMKVLQFGFGTESAHALDQFTENVVAYTGTHDNDTTRGWFEDDDPDRDAEREMALEMLDSDGSDFVWDMISAVFRSVADTAVVPLQDVLDLGTEARMNLPGSSGGTNWCWRFGWDQLTLEVVERMRRLVAETGRAPQR
jgi:4-alpha-glucanotransferase